MKLGQIVAITGFTFKDAVRKRAFWITNIIFMALILGASLLLPRVGGGMDPMAGMEAIVDPLGNAQPAETKAEDTYGGYTCYLCNESETLDAQAVLKNELRFQTILIGRDGLEEALAAVAEDGDGWTALVEITQPAQNEAPLIKITTRDFLSDYPADPIWQALSDEYRVLQFGALGYDTRQSAEILRAALPLEQEFATESNISNYVAGMALMLVMFMTIYVYGYGVATSVATEKSTRVMETLIVSAKPSRILLGKCVGMGLVGLAQMLCVLLFSFLCAKMFMPSGNIGYGLSLPSLTPAKAALLVLYFLLGYALFSMINSMCGAMVSKLEDLQSAMMPATMITMFSFYGGYVTMGITPAMGGSASLGRLMLLIPFTAPYAAPSVLLSGQYDGTLLGTSIAILLVAILIVSYLSTKVYAISVLHYGGRLRFSDVRKRLKAR